MAFSYNEVGAISPGDTISVPFGFLDRSHISVDVDGVVVTNWEWINNGLIKATAGIPLGAKTKVYRTTPLTSLPSTLQGASVFDWEGVNLNDLQALFVLQEYVDKEVERNDTIEFIRDIAEALDASMEDLAETILPALALKADKESPVLTGSPTTPTPATDASDFVIANMEAVRRAFNAITKTSLGLGSVDNVSAANLRDRDTHTGTQSADTITDSVTRVMMTPAERTKLEGVSSGATANATDAYLRARANHTGTQSISTVTGLQAALDAKATPADIASAVAGVVNSAPAALDTLKELSDALGNDVNFATTTATALGNRLRVDSAQTLSTAQKNQAAANLGIAPGATANATDAALRARSSHTGTQSADTITDSATKVLMTPAERTKLGGIATGATANDTDGNLRNRANHTGTQTAGTISDLTEVTQDMMASFLKAGTNITLTYNDAGNELTISASGSVATTASSVSVAAIAGITGTNAQAVLAEIDKLNLRDRGVIPGGADLNTYTTPGSYRQTASANAATGTNYPVPDAGVLEVVLWGVEGSTNVTQRYTPYRSSGGNASRSYSRTYYSGESAWGPWRGVYFLDEALTALSGKVNTTGGTVTGNFLVANVNPAGSLIVNTRAADTGTALNRWRSVDGLSDWDMGLQANSNDLWIRRYKPDGTSADIPFRIEQDTGDIQMPNILKLNKPVTINGRSHEFYAAEHAVHPGNTATANSAGLKAVVDAAQEAGGGRIVLPRGISPLSGVAGDRVDIPKIVGREIEIVGQGRGTGLGIPTGNNHAIYVGSTSEGGGVGVRFADMIFKGSSASSGKAIRAEWANLLAFENVQFRDMQVFCDATSCYGVDFVRCLAISVGQYGFVSSTHAHGLRILNCNMYSMGLSSTGTAIRLNASDMTDNIVIEGNKFEGCRQVLHAGPGGLSCTRINGNYIEYHQEDPLGFGAGANSYGIEIKSNWFAVGSQLLLNTIQNGEVKWNRFLNNDVANMQAGVEGGAAKNYLTGTSIWT